MDIILNVLLVIVALGGIALYVLGASVLLQMGTFGIITLAIITVFGLVLIIRALTI